MTAADEGLPARLSVVVDDIAFFAGDAIARPVTAELGATTPLAIPLLPIFDAVAPADG